MKIRFIADHCLLAGSVRAQQLTPLPVRFRVRSRQPVRQRTAGYSVNIPCIFSHSSDDQRVLVTNSLLFYEALERNSVPTGMHICPKAMHGFSLSPTHIDWFNQCQTWLKSSDWLKP